MGVCSSKACMQPDEHTQVFQVSARLGLIPFFLGLNNDSQPAQAATAPQPCSYHTLGSCSSPIRFLPVASLLPLSSALFWLLVVTVRTSFVLLLPCSHQSACRTQSFGFCLHSLPPFPPPPPPPVHSLLSASQPSKGRQQWPIQMPEYGIISIMLQRVTPQAWNTQSYIPHTRAAVVPWKVHFCLSDLCVDPTCTFRLRL